MNLKELSVSAETTTATRAIIKPTTVIANTISKEYLKVLELQEYCKIIESNIKEYEVQVEKLFAAKNESAAVKTDFKRRNKINAINSESLLQAKNELYKYKCELKSNYIATEKALNCKKLRYMKIISSYESKWQEVLKEFNANPVVVELNKLQEENNNLKNEIEKQEKLNFVIENEFMQIKESVKRAFSEKIVEFSTVMTEYKQFVDSQQNKEKAKSLKRPQESQGFKLFKEVNLPLSRKNYYNEDAQGFSSFDVSMFDEVIVPSENLESQHSEEDLYAFVLRKPAGKDQEESLQSEQQKQSVNQKSIKGVQEGVQSNAKPTTDENESQYFQTQTKGISKQSTIVPADNDVDKGAVETTEIVQKERQMNFEESLSEGSCENQFEYQRAEIHEYQYPKTSSFSSDGSSAEHKNSDRSPGKSFEDEASNCFKATDTQKNDFKAFTGFFTMGNDQDTTKPSIFKLF